MNVTKVPSVFFVGEFTFLQHPEICEFLDYTPTRNQLSVINDSLHSSLIVEKGRQSGFTSISIALAIYHALNGESVLILAQNRHMCDMINHMINRRIYMLEYDLKIKVISRINEIMGYRKDFSFVVLDERESEMWVAIQQLRYTANKMFIGVTRDINNHEYNLIKEVVPNIKRTQLLGRTSDFIFSYNNSGVNGRIYPPQIFTEFTLP